MKKTIEQAQVQHITDSDFMRTKFQEVFARDYPEQALHVRECKINRIYHKPGKRCGVTYRVSGENDRGQSFDQWFYGLLSLNGGGKETATPVPELGFWKPSTFLPELSLSLFSFPYDDKLPHLKTLLMPGYVNQQIEQNIIRFGKDQDWWCDKVEHTKIKYRVGKNCVLRFTATLANSASNEQVSYYSKTYKDEQGRYVFDILQVLERHLTGHCSFLNIPAPIIYLDDCHTLWQNEWPGQKISHKIRDDGWAVLAEPQYPRAIAGLLSELHQYRGADLPLRAGPTPRTILHDFLASLDGLQAYLPSGKILPGGIGEILTTAADCLQAGTQRRLIHGTFKLAQMLCREDKVAVVDFDSVAEGDPLYDVAEFVASVVYLQISDGVEPKIIEACVRQILACYQRSVPWECSDRRLAYYVCGFLLGKMRSSLKRLEATAISNFDSGLQLLRHWLARI